MVGPMDAVCRITQSIVRLKSNADIGQLSLTPIFTPKLDSLFPTLYLRYSGQLGTHAFDEFVFFSAFNTSSTVA